MNSKKIFQILLISIISLSLSSCVKSKGIIQKTDFKNEYKFSSEIEDKVAKDTVPWKYQISASDYAAKGDYENALKHWDLAMKPREKTFSQTQVDSINKKYTTVNARDYIIKSAKENQIIIINEAHHNSQHRMFTKSLLQKLFDIGYKNLGLEALTNNNGSNLVLNKRKYPIYKTGYYTKDPQFGNLIREALDIGYNVFPYEQTTNKNGKLREIEQAKNIQKIIAQKPNEKFLIHCGYDHALEGIHKSWEKAMAGRLNEYTGINPLTINQVFYSEKSDSKNNHPFLKALNIKETSIVIDDNNTPVKYKRGNAWSDIAIFHPNTKYINGRPNWLFSNENKNVSIKLEGIIIDYPVMVLAFKKGEDINSAIPIDITEVNAQNKQCNLGLKQGEYTIVVTNKKESIKFEKNVK